MKMALEPIDDGEKDMPLADDLTAEAKKIFSAQWATTTGRVVPDPTSVGLGNQAIEFDWATVLYADLDGSTNMVDNKPWSFSAEVYKAYLHCAAKIIRSEDGVITAYDGDRVMAVYIGENKNTRAVRTGLKINYAVRKILNPAIIAQYPQSAFVLKHVVGIDTSPIRAARTGVRGDNDLVWVGRAANYAAKLTTLSSDTPTWITEDVFKTMGAVVKVHDGKDMWAARSWTPMNGMRVYQSSWTWSV